MPKKLILDIDNPTWKQVTQYKIDESIKTMNKACVKLIKLGLKNRKVK